MEIFEIKIDTKEPNLHYFIHPIDKMEDDCCTNANRITQGDINEKIEALMKCDKMYVEFLESRFKIENEQVEFLQRLHSFQFLFSVNKRKYIKFRLFKLECEEISDRLSVVKKRLEDYQNTFADIFCKLIKSSSQRTDMLQMLKGFNAPKANEADIISLAKLTNILQLTNEAILLGKMKLDSEWMSISDFVEKEIMDCHLQFHSLYKEFSM